MAMSKTAVGPQMPFLGSSAGGAVVVGAAGGAVVVGAAIVAGTVVVVTEGTVVVVTACTCPEMPNTLKPGDSAE